MTASCQRRPTKSFWKSTKRWINLDGGKSRSAKKSYQRVSLSLSRNQLSARKVSSKLLPFQGLIKADCYRCFHFGENKSNCTMAIRWNCLLSTHYWKLTANTSSPNYGGLWISISQINWSFLKKLSSLALCQVANTQAVAHRAAERSIEWLPFCLPPSRKTLEIISISADRALDATVVVFPPAGQPLAPDDDVTGRGRGETHHFCYRLVAIFAKY